MSEMKSLCGSEVRESAGSCYAELLALRFFRRAIRNYTSKKVDDDLFRPLVRNIFNEKCVYDLQTRLIGPGSKKEELYYLGDDVGDADRLDALEAELAAKTGLSRRIGFAE